MISPSSHVKRLRQMPCVVCGTTLDIELHHCHSGSMGDAGWHRGWSQKANPFLQIPLNHEYHTGRFNPEAMGMRTWEATFGTQIDHLKMVSEVLGYDVIELAHEWEDG